MSAQVELQNQSDSTAQSDQSLQYPAVASAEQSEAHNRADLAAHLVAVDAIIKQAHHQSFQLAAMQAEHQADHHSWALVVVELVA
jgi:hypothetical protein